LYSRFEINNLSLGVNASLGGLNWKLSNVLIDDVKPEENESVTSLYGFVSAGVNYMITKQFGIGVNVLSLLGGTLKTVVYERTPAPWGFVFEVNYRF